MLAWPQATPSSPSPQSEHSRPKRAYHSPLRKRVPFDALRRGGAGQSHDRRQGPQSPTHRRSTNVWLKSTVKDAGSAALRVIIREAREPHAVGAEQDVACAVVCMRSHREVEIPAATCR